MLVLEIRLNVGKPRTRILEIRALETRVLVYCQRYSNCSNTVFMENLRAHFEISLDSSSTSLDVPKKNPCKNSTRFYQHKKVAVWLPSLI